MAIRAFLELGALPDRAACSVNAIVKAIYRVTFSKKKLLEWTTSEEVEEGSKNGVFNYYLDMFANVFFGFGGILISFFYNHMMPLVLGSVWILTPFIMSKLSKKTESKSGIAHLNSEEIDYIKKVGFQTWKYFKDYLNESTNYFPPDNYQEDRKEKIVYRTSPTNIGLALLAVVASYDLEFESLGNTIGLLEQMINRIDKLQKWNGHLFNWYDIKTLEPLAPMYVSSVDSGNFVGYLYVLKSFLVNNIDKDQKISAMIGIVDKIIENTRFEELYDAKVGLFSIGYNVEEGKITDCYYDLLASESRQTSLVAIAKKDVPARHWKNLSRSLTTLNKYKGLVSWAGTAFEYLMPNVNIRRYEGSLLDESCKFMIMSQMDYARKLGVAWGISESAFNLKDLNGNYQYKSFGIPWLGLKRGLADEMVVSSYGTILAIEDVPKDVYKNLKHLEGLGMFGKYGFFESIDYTPGRVEKGKAYAIVKTYMAHHQGLILLSLNNFINNNIMQKRFFENPEIQAIDILLQERMPDNVIVTKEQKEKVKKIRYKNYDYYAETLIDSSDGINEYNLISNNSYTVLIDKFGNGFSKFRDSYVNRFDETSNANQGILFYVKNLKSKKIWSPLNLNYICNDKKRCCEVFSRQSLFFEYS